MARPFARLKLGYYPLPIEEARNIRSALVASGPYCHLRVLAYLLASQTGIFCADVVKALKAARNVFDLPALVSANLFTLHAAAGAKAFLGTEFIDLGRDRKVFEVGQVPTSWASLHPSQLILA